MTDQIEEPIVEEQTPPEEPMPEEPTIEEPIKVYAQTDTENRITAVNSSIFLPDPTGWVQIDEGQGDRYAHAQGQYLPKGQLDENGCLNYALVDGVLTERTEAEKRAEIDARPEPLPNEADLLGQRMVEPALDPNPSANANGRRRIFYTLFEELKLLFGNKNPRPPLR